ncbi:MAG: Gfo/Idh/MocA family oxidoreductase [Prolixibacteraceae bacterium]|jgi:glucose-fructose oxidoreductase|nr:Gfo/Idh/MocA family oxidoreductase [Prolixibacteraceae bacterium]MBT6764611.1 Gfo/Idh/MocA family oxidoreductase [Prolixibacteraceae bacterium]MBT6999580.1 Gfo/Idh/MocA family oxidoreductase [Prolixibacteraceae bacterium]MBT7393621.1 Gfo/Idh/MocA family oxidoreductase [Prolixibacteraceae bacterium]
MNQSRRTFVKNISAATLAASTLSFPFVTFGKPVSQKKKLGIALIGLGYYSTDLLAPGLQQTENCYLSGIVTGSMDKEEIWVDKYNIQKKNIHNYENFDEIADNKDIDVVYVVLPNSMHKEFVIRAAKAGKHVICEKPMALNAEESREMIAACKTAGVSLSIGYRLRYEPYTQQIEKFARETTFGKLRFINTAAGFYMRRPTDNWKIKAEFGGGAMMDMGAYPLQAARYATGLEPISVTAQQINLDPDNISETDETTTFQLEFPNGEFAQCMTTFAGSVNFLKINAEKGEYGLEPFSGYKGLHGFLPHGKKFDFPEKHQQAHQMDEMCRAIMEGKPSLTPGEEGLRDMIIIDAIKESIKKGGKKVML